MTKRRTIFVSCTSVLCVLVMAGCGKKREDIAVYRVEKPAAQVGMPAMDSDAAAPSSMEMPSTSGAAAPEAAQPAKYGWDVPPSWKVMPASGMRAASFSFAASDKSLADISVVVLSGEAGGLSENINRWRGQIGLAALLDAEVTAAVKPLTTPAGELQTCAFSNPATKQAIDAAILADGESSWFFKMSGSGAAVSEGTASFNQFIESLRKNP